MSPSAVLAFVGLVLSAQGGLLEVEGDLVQLLQPGDRGQIFYQLTIGDEARTIEVGPAEAVRVDGDTVTLRQLGEEVVRAGFSVRFEVPHARLAQPDPKLDAEIADLRRRLQGESQLRLQAEEGADRLRAELAAAGHERERARRLVEEESRARSVSEETLTTVRTRLARADAELAELRPELEKRAAEIQRLSSELRQDSGSAAKMKSHLAAAKSETRDLLGRVEVLEGQRAALIKEVETLEAGRDELAQVGEQRARLQRELDGARQQAATLSAERSRREERLAERATEIGGLSSEVAALKGEREGLASEVERLEAERRRDASRIVELEAASEAAGAASGERLDEARRLRDELAQAGAERNRLERDLAEALDQLSRAASPSPGETADLDRLVAEKQALELKVEALIFVIGKQAAERDSP